MQKWTKRKNMIIKWESEKHPVRLIGRMFFRCSILLHEHLINEFSLTGSFEKSRLNIESTMPFHGTP